MIEGVDLQRPTYTCLQTIGEGGVGICRKGYHDVFGKMIVQKTTPVMHVPDGIAQEPRLLESADHPNIIKVREAQWDDEFIGVKAVTFTCPYFPDGSVLEAFRDGHSFDIDTVVNVARNILDALAYLHGEKGYLHRDIKPGNILLDDGRTSGCLADLGSAAILEGGGADNNGGTLLYLDPAAKTTGRMTVQSDLYSLGMTLTEMLRGRFPYETVVDDTLEDRLESGKRSLPDNYFSLPPETPTSVARMIRALAKSDPAKRPSSAEEALRKLNRIDYMPWSRTSGVGLVGAWEARWPRSGRSAVSARDYRVVVQIPPSDETDKVRFDTSQRIPGSKWRRITNLCGYINANDSGALERVFRDVERHVQ